MSAVSYKSIAKRGTLIGDFMFLMSEYETAYAYDFWAALWLLSTVVGRNCVVARPNIPVHLNLFVLLVAESGVTRKSTAIRIATTILRDYLKNSGEHIEIISEKASPESLELMMHKNTAEYGKAHMTFSISELVRFMGKQSYVASIPGLLVDLYDCPKVRDSPGTLVRGDVNIWDVYPTFFSASTPSWLLRSINPDVIAGGLTSRMLFVVSEKRKKRVAWPVGSIDISEQNNLINLHLAHTQALSKKFPEIKLTDNALTKFVNWYEQKPMSSDPFRSSFESREDDHVLTIAALLSINEDRWEINAHDIAHAIKIVREVKTNGYRIFEGGVTTEDKLIVGIEKLREKLIEVGVVGIRQTDLYQYVRRSLDKEQFTVLLRVMHEVNMVQKFQENVGGRGRKPTVWRATKLIKEKEMLEVLNNELNK